jgi:hypothetical protein
MKELPILFSGPMVRAILEGRKSQTRRVVKGLTPGHEHTGRSLTGLGYPASMGKWWAEFLHSEPGSPIYVACPYGQPGDRLWVRETWCPAATSGYDAPSDGRDPSIWYRATDDGECEGPWSPSIFMPRWASRIELEVTGVRVERVQEISPLDAIAEGIMEYEPGAFHWEPWGPGTEYFRGPRDAFLTLWDSINAKRGHGWDVNPWVWVVEFRVGRVR